MLTYVLAISLSRIFPGNVPVFSKNFLRRISYDHDADFPFPSIPSSFNYPRNGLVSRSPAVVAYSGSRDPRYCDSGVGGWVIVEGREQATA